MIRDSDAYKEYIRCMVGEIYWESPPAMYLFQREYMSREGALLFALEHCQFTDTFPRWFGNIIANCPFIDARAYMIENMFVEEVKDPTIDVACGVNGLLAGLPTPPGASSGPNLSLSALMGGQP